MGGNGAQGGKFPEYVGQAFNNNCHYNYTT